MNMIFNLSCMCCSTYMLRSPLLADSRDSRRAAQAMQIPPDHNGWARLVLARARVSGTGASTIKQSTMEPIARTQEVDSVIVRAASERSHGAGEAPRRLARKSANISSPNMQHEHPRIAFGPGRPSSSVAVASSPLRIETRRGRSRSALARSQSVASKAREKSALEEHEPERLEQPMAPGASSRHTRSRPTA
jgi:hypothetical protein